MRKYDNLPISKLVSDVAVDPVHVRELADSIKVSGPISPVLVREESLDLIDGFHRVAAMKELGFDRVECIITPCDQATFWDLRIMSATLHKTVTFARAVDWIEEAFVTSPWKDKHKSAKSLFQGVRQGYVTGDAKSWVEMKAQKWGLEVRTIENWLVANQKLATELHEEIKSASIARRREPSHYVEVAMELGSRPDLQKRVLDKVEAEDVGTTGIREVAKAIRGAADDKEVETILREPLSRTAEDLGRAAKVEKILAQPREIPIEEKWQQAKADDVLFKLDLLSMIASTKTITQEEIDALTTDQKEDVFETCEKLIREIRRVMDIIKPSTEVEYRLIEPTEHRGT